jgi:iron-sulfur cluster insertion protein
MAEQESCGVNPEMGTNAAGPAEFMPEAPEAVEGEETLVSLTRLAAEKVLEIRTAEGIEEEMALRLRVVGGGCSGFSYDLYFDGKNEMDRELESYGVRMVVDQMSLMYLVGTQIDYVEGLAGAGFKFQNPNVKSTCGCGSSFQV